MRHQAPAAPGAVRTPAALYPLVFASGALGLAYEVLWMRAFTTLFGGTSLAVAATLSAFFLGTTAGSLVLGARARTWARPLVAFGLLEIGVGLGALLVHPVLHLYPPLYPALYRAFGALPLPFALVKLVLAMAAIGVPTFFMGGTLPALGEGVVGSVRNLGAPVGGLYAANLLGAAIGALAVPFLLLPWMGARDAYLCAVGGSLAVGTAAATLGWRSSRPRVDAGSPPPAPASGHAHAGPGSRHVLLFAAWSGLCVLGLETLWSRMFSLVHENSVYSFAVVVVVFLAGLALGAARARRALARGRSPVRFLARAWWMAGTWIVLSPRLFALGTAGLEYLPSADWRSSLARLLALAVLVALPACVGLGAALPLLMEMSAREGESAGPILGRLLAANTVGALIGPLAVAFVVAPALGLWNSIALLGSLTVVTASGAGLTRGERWGSWTLLVAALLAVRPGTLPPARIRPGEKLVSVREGSYGTTAVLEDEADRWMTVNNSYVLGGAATADEERWQGHLPLFLHPAPRRVAYVGLGTGITAGAALRHPVEEVTALEIVPEVAAAARADFADLNARLLSDPRARLVIDDGRNFLSAAPHVFDVVVGDLLVPWRPGESALYTKEHFETVRAALAPDGLFCLWLPLYQLSRTQLVMIVATFRDVFPRVTVWRGGFLPGEPTLALVGHRDPAPLDAAAIDARVAGLAASASRDNAFLAGPAGLWVHLVGSLGEAASPGQRRNRDDEPWVELTSGRGEPAIVGAPLESYLTELAGRPIHDSPLARLDSAQLAWREAGMALASAALVPGPEGQSRVLSLLRTLPPELQGALGVAAP